jgi:hypothetical protein
VETEKLHVPVIVSTGVLTQADYDALDPETRRTVDTTTARLVTRYGEAWLRTERERLRGELSFFYGI